MDANLFEMKMLVIHMRSNGFPVCEVCTKGQFGIISQIKDSSLNMVVKNDCRKNYNYNDKTVFT